jgi:hypothetical protein
MSVKINLAIILRFFVGTLFLFSGIAKLFPIETFEFSLVSQGIAGWSIVPYLSRFIVASEIFLGLAFFQNDGLKRIFIPAAFLMLLIFSFHLLYTIFTVGSTGNCGCFGQLIPMTPLEALIKNIVLLVFLIYIYQKTISPPKLLLAIPTLLLIISFAVIFIGFRIEPYEVFSPSTVPQRIQNESTDQKITSENFEEKDQFLSEGEEQLKPVESDSPQTKLSEETTKTVTSEKNQEQIGKEKFDKSVSQFSRFSSFSNSEKVDLDEGEKIVAVLSLDCDHCMDTANKLGRIKDEITLPPVYFLFLGEEDQLNDFFDSAGAEFPYLIITPSQFFPLIENFPPRICYLIEGNIVGDWDYETFSEENLKKTLNKFSAITSIQ